MNSIDFVRSYRNRPISGRLRHHPSKGCFPVHGMRPTNVRRPTITDHGLGTPMFLARSLIALST